MSDCKHGWITPPECPQCVSDERDQLAEDVRRLKEALTDTLQMLKAYAVPEGAAISQAREALAATEPAPVGRDWTEDAAHENGNYQNTCAACGRMFHGHKRRVWCKKCATEPAPNFSSKPDFVKWVPLEDAEALAKALEKVQVWLPESGTVREALAAFRAKHPAPVEETAVEKARREGVCRVCGKAISRQDWPKDATVEFGELLFPERVTLRYGNEFAHTECLALVAPNSACDAH